MHSFVNDSKATNVGSATATINSYFSKRKGVLIAGGLSKGGDMREFAETISNFCHSVVLIGSCAKELESILSNRVLCKVVKNLKKAVQEASLLAKNGDTVLLEEMVAAAAESGADYAKIDSCGGSQDHDTAFSDYSKWRDGFNKTGRPIYFSLCGWHTWYAPVGAKLGNSWRIAGDGTNWYVFFSFFGCKKDILEA